MSDLIYQFESVELDPVARSLRVNGQFIACPRLVFDLLHVLCAHAGVLLRRDWLIEQLWPEDEVVADESLTQVLFRLRNSLGACADSVVTVRGQGVRLDATVTRVERPPPPAVKVIDTAEPSAVGGQLTVDRASSIPTVRPGRPTATVVAIVIVVVVVVALLLAYQQWMNRPAAAPVSLVDEATIGVDLRADDLHTSHDQTYAILRSALAADAQGDRGRALALLRAAHDGDTKSPYPAVWLAMLSPGAIGEPTTADWLPQSEARAAEFNDPLLATYLGLARAMAEADRQATRNHLRALLDLRPRSWMWRQVLARQLLVDGDLAGALAESRRIDYAGLGTRRLEDALGDRAALGDVAQARQTLERIAPTPSDPGTLSVAARISYSAGDFAAAESQFEQSNQAAAGTSRIDLRIWNSIMLALLAAENGNYERALGMLDEVGFLYHDAIGESRMPVEAQLLRAQWLALQGEDGKAEDVLVKAYARAQTEDPGLLNLTRLIALRLSGRLVGEAPDATDSAAYRGETHLIEGRLAWLAGDRAGAEHALDQANALNLGETAQYLEALLLARDLGRAIPMPTRPLDPPLPLTRWPAYFALRGSPGPGAQPEQANVPQP